MEVTVISVEEYLNLREDSEKLSRLKSSGVDNWEWYGEALHGDEHEPLDKFREDLAKKVAEDFVVLDLNCLRLNLYDSDKIYTELQRLLPSTPKE